MYINATLLIQICNFLITYWFLNRFFFRPFLAILTRKENEKKALTTFLKDEETSIHNLEQERTNKLLMFQKYVKTHYMVEEAKKEALPDQAPVKYDKQEVENLITEAKKTLIEKVSREY